MCLFFFTRKIAEIQQKKIICQLTYALWKPSSNKILANLCSWSCLTCRLLFSIHDSRQTTVDKLYFHSILVVQNKQTFDNWRKSTSIFVLFYFILVPNKGLIKVWEPTNKKFGLRYLYAWVFWITCLSLNAFKVVGAELISGTLEYLMLLDMTNIKNNMKRSNTWCIED